MSKKVHRVVRDVLRESRQSFYAAERTAERWYHRLWHRVRRFLKEL